MLPKLNLRRLFAEHLLTLVRDALPAKDAEVANTVLAQDRDLKRAPHFLASALFIFQQGTISETPRRVVRSRQFNEGTEICASRNDLNQLIEHLSDGGPLLRSSRSHHAKRVLCRARDNATIFLDRCFLDWGVHHFHVFPNARSRDCLVYASFDETTIYLLSLGGHSLLNDSMLVESMSEVCPQLLQTVAGINGDDFQPAEIKTLRAKNANFAVRSNGRAVVPRIPCSSGGIPTQVLRDVDFEIAHLEALEAALTDPGTERYRHIQNTLKTVRPLALRVVTDSGNFRGSLLLYDETTNRQIHLNYR